MALTDNLVSCYLFTDRVSDNEGNYTLDESGTSCSVSAVNTKIEIRRANFDGAGNLEQPAAATNSLNAWTISAWIILDGTGVACNVWAKNSATDRAQYGYTGADGMGLQINSDGNFTVDNLFTPTNWTHFMWASDGTNAYIVVNGVVRAKEANSADLSASGKLYIGHNSVNGNEQLVGGMEQFALWDICIDGISGKNSGDSVTGDAADLYNGGTGLARADWDPAPAATTNSTFFGMGI